MSESSVLRYLHLFQTTGDVLAKNQRQGTLPFLSDFEELTVLQTFLDKPGLYLREVQQELFDVTGSWYDCSNICRTAKRLGLPRQKSAIQRSKVKRAEYISEIQELKPEMLVFIDETGSLMVTIHAQ